MKRKICQLLISIYSAVGIFFVIVFNLFLFFPDRVSQMTLYFVVALSVMLEHFLEIHSKED